ncbi:MAG: hypothetical protein II855_03020 [Candidatus Methanomethylophilaceae archaeon]|nr:hypothetical protein [Candidatus Methanomethylophilaceae archaeon]
MKEHGKDNNGLTINVNIENVNVYADGHVTETDDGKYNELASEIYTKIITLKNKLDEIGSELIDKHGEDVVERDSNEIFGIGFDDDDEEDDDDNYYEDDIMVGPLTSDDDLDDIKESFLMWTNDNSNLTDAEARCIKRLANSFRSEVFLEDLLCEVDVCFHKDLEHLLERLPFSSPLRDRDYLLSLIEPVKDILDAV